MIVLEKYWPNLKSHAGNGPIGGDQSKPGAWTQEQIADWNCVKACADQGHPPFEAMAPRDTDDTCPGCRAIVRSVTTAQGWADHWAEQTAEDRASDGWDR